MAILLNLVYTISNGESQVFTPNNQAWSERDSNPGRRRDKRAAYSQIAYGKLCARLFHYPIWWVRVMVEGWGFG